MTHSKDITSILSPIVERWKSVAKATPVVRKDLPGASAEWCFSPRVEDERALLALLEEWDRMEDSLLPDLAGTPPLKQAEFREVLRIIRHKLDLNRRNRHFVGYSGKSDPDGEMGRGHFLASMERTVHHLIKLNGEISVSRKPGDLGKTSP
jgi:hypothetical protein